jgi:serine/threonine-protein kinase
MLVCTTCRNPHVDDPERCLHCGARRPREGWERETLTGAVLLGRYVVERRLGAGATGVVYRARDRRAPDGARGGASQGRDARVAVKFLHREQVSDERLVLRFRREALAASQVEHSGVARTIAYGEQDGAVFLVMEYVDGISLEARLRDAGPLPPGRAAALAADIADALAAAHAQGVVHRDLKPANIWLVPGPGGRETTKVLDFGYALIQAPEKGFWRVTRTGFLVGSPAYMSPEQTLPGATVDARTDLYALGIVLYRLLTGRRPFVAPTLVEQVRQQRQERPARPRAAAPGRAIPRSLERIVLRLLEKEPGRRFQTGTELAQALRQLRLPDDPTAAAPPAAAPGVPGGGRARILEFLRGFAAGRRG